MAKPSKRKRKGFAASGMTTDKKRQEKECGKPDRKKRKQFYRKIVLICELGILIILVIGITIWSAAVGELSVCLNYWAETVSGMPTAVLGCGGIVGFIMAKDNRKLVVCILCSLVILVVLGCPVRVVAELAEKHAQEVQRISEDEKEKPEPKETDFPQYEKIAYNQETDPFMERLEEYCGVEKGSIHNEEIPERMAEVIVDDILRMRKTKETKISVPEAYIQDTQIADGQYKTYIYQYSRDKKVENGSDEKNQKDSSSEGGDKKEDERNQVIKDRLKEKRMNDLLDAKNLRIEADREYEDAENRRLIGLYCIDYGDEYASDDQKNASDSYEEAAEWGMKAFYAAAIACNFQKMEEVCNILSDASDNMDKLSEIGSERKKKLKNCSLAYKIVLSML